MEKAIDLKVNVKRRENLFIPFCLMSIDFNNGERGQGRNRDLRLWLKRAKVLAFLRWLPPKVLQI